MTGPCGSLAATGTGPPDSADLCGVSFGPALLDLYLYQGDDERRTIRWVDTTGVAVADLTGAEAKLQIRTGPADTDPTVITEVAVGSGITITDGPNAVLTVLISSAKTVLLTGSDPYWYDLQVKPVGGDLRTILRGRIYFDLEVTR